MSRYETEPFQPDGGFSIVGLPLLIAIVAVTGVAVGWLASFIGQWIYLIIIWPAGMGFALFFAGLLGAKLARMRNSALAFVLGFLGGTVTIVALHYFDYQRANLPLSFLGYLNAEAAEGITIGSRGGGLNIGYWGTWIYWVLEYLAVSFLAVIGIFVTVTDPYCTTCERWKETKQLGTLNRKGVNVAAYVQEGKLERLREHDPAPTGNDLVLSVAVCPVCRDEGPIEVKLEQIKKNDKGEESREEVAHVVYPGEALAELEDLFAFGQPIRKRRRRRRDDDDDA